MARKTKTEQNKEKAAKQKKIAIGGGIVFVALLAIQVPRTMKMMSGHPAPPVVSATAADGTTTTTVAPTDPNSLAAPTLAGSPTATTAAPVFHLISLTPSTAKLGIAGGSYADGSQAITLKLKTPVTLQNTADGTKYTLILEPPSTPVSSAAPTAPASTTPATVPAVP